MAKQIVTLLTDDLDGSEADETVMFSLDGRDYEIDLNDAHAAELREFLERFATSGTRVSRNGSGVGRGVQVKRSGVDHPSFATNKKLNQAIRAWATQNGFELAERGRIPQHIVDAYHNGTTSNVRHVPQLPFATPAAPEPTPTPAKVVDSPKSPVRPAKSVRSTRASSRA